MLGRFLALATLIAPLATATLLAAEPQGRLIIHLTDADTGRPIAGARVPANLGTPVAEEGQTLPPDRLTGENGRFALQVPFGNVRLTPPILPPGYWPVTEKSLGLNQLQQFAITREQPVVEKHFTAKKGTLWPMKLVTASGAPLPDIEVHAHRNSDHSQSALVTDAAGQGRLTLPTDGGNLSVGFFQRRRTFYPRAHAFVEIDADFDPRAVASQAELAEGKKIELTDKQGHKAVWEGCSVTLRDGAAELIFIGEDPASGGTGEFAGTVVDQLGQPIAGASVRCYAPGLDAVTSLAKTDERGGFHFRGLSKSGGAGNPAGIHLIVNKDGYAGMVAEHFFVPNADGLHRLDRALVLQQGYSLPVQILDEDDKPVGGASINALLSSTQSVKSDARGHGILRNLPTGPLKLRVSYGDKRADAQATVSPLSATQPPIVVHLAPAPLREPAKRPKPEFPRVGELAPEWTIHEWTDGQERTLASLRGRVVFIDFWSLGCTPCRQVTLPVENQLRRKFASDVTFIHLHHAGTEPTLIKELLAVQNWDLLVGCDRGTSATESETFNRYGVTGYPTEVIIDRQGRIAFHSSEGRDDKVKVAAAMQVTAAEIGLPWPIEKDADQDEIARRLRRYHEHWLTKEIEKALAK